MGDDNRNDNAMLEQRIAGRSIIAIAEQYQCTTSDVEGALERRLSFTLDRDQRLKAVKLDCSRLEALLAPFFERATKDKDVQAGTLCVKILERRALLLGLDHPTQSRIDVYQVEQQKQPSRHDRIMEAFQRLRDSAPPAEKALRERLDQLTTERALELLGPLEPEANGNGAALPSPKPEQP